MEFKKRNVGFHKEIVTLTPSHFDVGVVNALKDDSTKEITDNSIYNLLSYELINMRQNFIESLQMLAKEDRSSTVGGSVFDYKLTEIFNGINEEVYVDSLVEDMNDILKLAETSEEVKNTLTKFTDMISVLTTNIINVLKDNENVTIPENAFVISNVLILIKDLSVISKLSGIKSEYIPASDVIKEFMENLGDNLYVKSSRVVLLTNSGRTYFIKYNKNNDLVIKRYQ